MNEFTDTPKKNDEWNFSEIVEIGHIHVISHELNTLTK